MATIKLGLDVAGGGDEPYSSGTLRIARVVSGDSIAGYVDGSWQRIPLSNPMTVLGEDGFAPLERGVTYGVVYPSGLKLYYTMPNLASVNLSDLLPVIPVPPAPPTTYTQEEIDELIADVAGGSDAGVAGWVTGGTLTPKALAAHEDAITTERNVALRAARIALKAATATGVDVVVAPTDSIGEGASVTTAANRWTQILVKKLRKAYVPAIKGGYGYYGAGSNILLAGDPAFSLTGTVTINNVNGLGRKSVRLAAGATYIWYAEMTGWDILLTTGAGGSTYELKTNKGPGVSETTITGTTAAGATGHVKRTKTGLDGTGYFITVTNTGAGVLELEGCTVYNGDQTAGVRIWEGGRSGYMAEDFDTSTAWADSLPLVPNAKLVIMPIGSNDFYYGKTPAATKTRLESIITRLRTKLGTDPTIVLVGYYDRDAPAKVADWSAFTEVYKEIAAADAKVTFLDLVPIFGPWVGGTDDRGGLTSNTDYVHPFDPGAQLIADALFEFITGPGGEIAQAAAALTKSDVGLDQVDNTSDANKPLSTATLLAVGGDQSGVFNMAGFPAGALSLGGFNTAVYQGFRLQLAGNISFDGANKPAVSPATNAFHFWLLLIQDATGNRTLTMTNVVKAAAVGAVVLSTAAGAKDLLLFRWTGYEVVLTNFLKGLA